MVCLCNKGQAGSQSGTYCMEEPWRKGCTGSLCLLVALEWVLLFVPAGLRTILASYEAGARGVFNFN